MKAKYLTIIFSFLALSALICSCKKPEEPDDKNKIDIKGTLMNGDMRHPNIKAEYDEKTVWVWFYEEMGPCTISISDRDSSVVVCDTINTRYDASWSFYMGNQPLTYYHLVISDGTDEAEGWFYNFRLVAVRP